MEADIRVFDTVDSTNIRLDELARSGEKEGTCVVAFCQTKGQGRSGRTFFSPEGGNLYLSLLLRPKSYEAAEKITIEAATAAVKAINDHFGVDCGIKWVNDIYLSGKKVCGIIAQAGNYDSDEMYVILGVGINIYEAPDVPEDILDIYASVTGKACDKTAEVAKADAIKLAKEFIDNFAYYYDDPGTSCIDEYRKYSIVTGMDVEYFAGDHTLAGKVTGIDDSGSLVLETKDGIRTFRDGEIRIRLRR